MQQQQQQQRTKFWFGFIFCNKKYFNSFIFLKLIEILLQTNKKERKERERERAWRIPGLIFGLSN